MGTIDGADNAHLLGTPACDMVETAQQPAGWCILALGVKFTGFWGWVGGWGDIYNILDFWRIDKEMVRQTNMSEVNFYTPHLGYFIQYQKNRVNHQVEKKVKTLLYTLTMSKNDFGSEF